MYKKKKVSVNSTDHDLDARFLQYSKWISYGKDRVTGFHLKIYQIIAIFCGSFCVITVKIQISMQIKFRDMVKQFFRKE